MKSIRMMSYRHIDGVRCDRACLVVDPSVLGCDKRQTTWGLQTLDGRAQYTTSCIVTRGKSSDKERL